MTAKGYWVGRISVHDDEKYAEYAAAANPVYAAHGGTPLVRGGQFEAVEGTARPRNVVIEFPSYRRRWTATTHRSTRLRERSGSALPRRTCS